MAKEDIEKLKEKVEKDPLSKLFVPLAEEYRKAGMVDEAISVLLRGLENQPSYMTARVALGKIYLEKNMLKEARDEFKKVITVIPDNLFALKKVAEISAELGEISEAIDAYSKIVKLNTLDEDAKSALETLKIKKVEEGKPEPQQHPKKSTDLLGTPPVSRPAEPSRPEKPVKEEPEHFDLEGFMPVNKTSYSEEEFEKFKDEFYSKETLHEEVTEVQEILEVKPEPEITSYPEEQEATTLEVDNIKTEEEFFVEAPETEVEEITTVEPVQAEPEITTTGFEMPELDFSYPDRLIQQGNYPKAIEVYKKMLSDHPEDKRIIQRFVELKAFLKILGKDKEVITQQLINFLEAIKKRKDELLRNP